jgi:hypothetical protein
MDITGLVDRAGNLVHGFLDRILRVTSGLLDVTLGLLRGFSSCNNRNRLRSRSLALPIASFATPERASFHFQSNCCRVASQNYLIDDPGWIERRADVK